MLELLTGVALAIAAGLNAYVPLLGLGLLARFTELVDLPTSWAWIENGWVLTLLVVLLAVETLVDKVPALDTVNDVLQTVVRPASGGMVFSAGANSETVAVTDPATFVQSDNIWPFVLGIVIALIPHALKALVRPAINLATGGVGGPVMSFFEDIGAIVLTLLAVIVPVVAVALAIIVTVALARRLRRAFTARAARRAGQSPDSSVQL